MVDLSDKNLKEMFEHTFGKPKVEWKEPQKETDGPDALIVGYFKEKRRFVIKKSPEKVIMVMGMITYDVYDLDSGNPELPVTTCHPSLDSAQLVTNLGMTMI